MIVQRYKLFATLTDSSSDTNVIENIQEQMNAWLKESGARVLREQMCATAWGDVNSRTSLYAIVFYEIEER